MCLVIASQHRYFWYGKRYAVSFPAFAALASVKWSLVTWMCEMCRQRPSVLLTCPGKYISGALVIGILNKPSSLYRCLHKRQRRWYSRQHRPNGLFHVSVTSSLHFGWFLIPSYFHRQVLHDVGYTLTMWHNVSALNAVNVTAFCLIHPWI